MVRRGSLSRQRFERLVRRALATLPEEFQSRLENVVVVIEDKPPEYMPDRITLFKVPIERTCRTEEEIEAEVRLTVLHEVGHFFGLEEAQLE